MPKPKCRYIKSAVKITSLILFLAGLNLSAQQRADFLLVENPSALIMYNGYQQNLDESNKNMIYPFVPMRITERDGILPDGIRAYMKVSINDVPFYLLTDDGVPVNLDKAGRNFTAEDVPIINDTVRVNSSSGIQGINIDGSSVEVIENDAIIIRRFLMGDNVYSTVLKFPQKIFTIPLNELKAKTEPFSKLNGSMAEKKISGDVIKGIEKLINRYNGKLAKMFSYFNDTNRDAKEIPFWKVEADKDSIVITPSDSILANKFNESLQFLKDDLTTSLIRTRLQLYSRNELMIIK